MTGPFLFSLFSKQKMAQQQQQRYRTGVLVGNYCEELLLEQQQQQQQSIEMETEQQQKQQLQVPRALSASAEHFAPPSREATLAAAASANDARWAAVVNAEGRGAAEALFGVREIFKEKKKTKTKREEEEEEHERRAEVYRQQQRRRQWDRQRRLPPSSQPSPPREQLLCFRPPVEQRPSFRPRGEATALFDESLARMNLRRP